MRTSLRRSFTALGAGLVLAGCSSGPFAVERSGDPTTTTAQRPSTTANGSGTTDATGSTDTTARPNGSGFGRGLAFSTFDSCDAFLDYVREHALDQVGAYGFGVNWYGRGIDDMAETTMAASADGDTAGSDPLPAAQDEEAAAGGGTSGTNTQEEGVDEGDLVETDGRYVYTIVDGRTLSIVDTIDATLVSTLRLDPDEGASQMILDGTRLALVVNGWGGGAVPLDAAGRPASDFGYGYGYGLTGVSVIDVADPAAPTNLGTSWFEGSAQAVRATDGVVRVVVTSGLGDRLPLVVPANGSLRGEARAEELNRQLVEESVAEDWLPRRIDEAPDGTTSAPITTIGCDRIGQPEEFSGLGLTWVATVDLRADAPETTGSAGVVSTGGTTYASAEHLYVSTVRWDPAVDGVQPIQPEAPTTAIHSFAIAGRADAVYEASGAIDGTLLNQFSMSEYEGRLRVATTTFEDGFGASNESQVRVLERTDTTLEQIGVVDGLGVSEQIYSVRFLGNLAYVVTFRQMDPLYVVDLTDPTAPVVRGELKIPGYSAYLHPVGDGRLLGVGQDATDDGGRLGAQASLFDVSDPANPIRLSTAALGSYGTPVEWDHHAFLYWPETGQLVLPVDPYWCAETAEIEAGGELASSCEQGGAVVVQVQGDALAVQGRIIHPVGNTDLYEAQVQRSMVVDGRLVTVSAAGVLVSDLATLGQVHWIPLS
ncbi:MAG: beta-propeller domain-containing protein [Acidimicrobiia bacterium]